MNSLRQVLGRAPSLPSALPAAAAEEAVRHGRRRVPRPGASTGGPATASAAVTGKPSPPARLRATYLLAGGRPGMLVIPRHLSSGTVVIARPGPRGARPSPPAPGDAQPKAHIPGLFLLAVAFAAFFAGQLPDSSFRAFSKAFPSTPLPMYGHHPIRREGLEEPRHVAAAAGAESAAGPDAGGLMAGRLAPAAAEASLNTTGHRAIDGAPDAPFSTSYADVPRGPAPTSGPASVASPLLSRDALVLAAEKALQSTVSIRLVTMRDKWGSSGETLPQSSSEGSGFFISEDGAVLTNAHVISAALSDADPAKSVLRVTDADGRVFHAEVLAVDPITDLAILQTYAAAGSQPASRVTPATFSQRSADLRPGEYVVAVGCPLGFKNSISAGILSATTRRPSDVGAVENGLTYLQNNFPLNQGNSGGPLLDLDGNVIGINTVKLNGEGISFAIRIDTALPFIRQLAQAGRVQRTPLGRHAPGSALVLLR
ncbi:hypothetical protein H696_01323 [Fonticula alba]|uniref:PDZ domain-containing protein n=1 Tax=Fonticula alba TaxID=691883 RepID=A0A058ZDA6_FONAL|nr:hypothetical protein H696_01323 [Fonticula alba]KCV71913.1 hypothetical protein H696_01323 [Fonticula alba]|eukprot:XP_009493491.1 hypothetical protein H696_01323 [Fonticula alba]